MLVARAGGCANQPSGSSAEADNCGELASPISCRLALGECQAGRVTCSGGLTVYRAVVGAFTKCGGCFGACGRGQLERRLP